ncbi:uncharacterized protein K441DRAFT_547211, partial [Cenococcum geophilum 1.58]|uniref:uncharacterized protein n=1 Tax=Cenococcum geophilum 1.58 TaxID=794803 RepID=UPI00358F80A7
MGKRISIIRNFLHSLLGQAVKREAVFNLERWSLDKECSPDKNIKKILNAPVNELFTALRAVLGDQEQRGLSLIVDGLDKVEHQRDECIRGVRAFIEHLQQRASKVKILLTSQPLAEIRELFNGLPCIEYDRERKDCLASLRFDNTRYKKILPQYKGSFEWIWVHDEYKNWCTSDTSRLLYIQGKPGSGKSTITKYFSNHLLERERAAKSAIIAKFFYSYREGELQRSHYSMFQSILYDILHEDEAFFYHRFQTEYRTQCRDGYLITWDYASLKTVLKSLQDHSLAKPLYLIIDALDESENNDRRDVLDLLFKLCSETKYCIMKIFIASRPLGQLELCRTQFHNFIRLQDNTKADISSFALSFLNRLSLRRRSVQVREYIVENAQGVFLWVELVGKELLACEESGYSEEDIIEFLKCLPKELETFYELMLERMTTKKSNIWNLRNLQDLRNHRDLQDGIKMFRLVLWARRPLTVNELLHALGIPDDPDTRFIPDDSFQIPILLERRIISCGGNFLVIKSYHGTRNGTVQVMHQTVREFFLDPNGLVASSEFRMCEKDAHVCISVTCLRYLMLCAANTTLAGRPPDIEFWTWEHFKGYAQYLDNMPLANYALGHLKHHIDG